MVQVINTTKEVLCTSPNPCKQKSFKLVGIDRIYICTPRTTKIGNIKFTGLGWCSYQKTKGHRSYHQKIQGLKKWARKGER